MCQRPSLLMRTRLYHQSKENFGMYMCELRQAEGLSRSEP
jgi:hypothetical protein